MAVYEVGHGISIPVEDVRALMVFSTEFEKRDREEKEVREYEENREQTRRQQRRLLELYHSFYCQDMMGCCTNKEYAATCVDMRKLWVHFGSCTKMKKCETKSCSSSRYMLKHFKNCPDASCVVCSFVRRQIYYIKNGRILFK